MTSTLPKDRDEEDEDSRPTKKRKLVLDFSDLDKVDSISFKDTTGDEEVKEVDEKDLDAYAESLQVQMLSFKLTSLQAIQDVEKVLSVKLPDNSKYKMLSDVYFNHANRFLDHFIFYPEEKLAEIKTETKEGLLQSAEKLFQRAALVAADQAQEYLIRLSLFVYSVVSSKIKEEQIIKELAVLSTELGKMQFDSDQLLELEMVINRVVVVCGEARCETLVKLFQEKEAAKISKSF